MIATSGSRAKALITLRSTSVPHKAESRHTAAALALHERSRAPLSLCRGGGVVSRPSPVQRSRASVSSTPLLEMKWRCTSTAQEACISPPPMLGLSAVGAVAAVSALIPINLGGAGEEEAMREEEECGRRRGWLGRLDDRVGEVRRLRDRARRCRRGGASRG